MEAVSSRAASHGGGGQQCSKLGPQHDTMAACHKASGCPHPATPRQQATRNRSTHRRAHDDAQELLHVGRERGAAADHGLELREGQGLSQGVVMPLR